MAIKKEKTILEQLESLEYDKSAMAYVSASTAGALVKKLEKSGIDTPEKLMKLTLNDLLQIKGIGRGSALALMEVACNIAGKK